MSFTIPILEKYSNVINHRAQLSQSQPSVARPDSSVFKLKGQIVQKNQEKIHTPDEVYRVRIINIGIKNIRKKLHIIKAIIEQAFFRFFFVKSIIDVIKDAIINTIKKRMKIRPSIFLTFIEKAIKHKIRNNTALREPIIENNPKDECFNLLSINTSQYIIYKIIL